ncbi:MAG: NAD(P)H-dependent oxidoreductase [Candidatus Peribacteraceae bacterium]|nr:NAD(P)H-dependent oxidoreductase [Candidatus Peribacteraceae bacterium]
MSQFIDALNWRYATKKFDATKKISQADLDELLESLRLSASSYGLQPWKFLVITDPAMRQKLQAVAWNQSQITESSHLIVLCAKTDIDEQYIKDFVAFTAKERGADPATLAGYQEMMVKNIASMPIDMKQIWMAKQAYIALGTLLTAAAFKKIDATPMEGFDKAKFDEILDLKKKGWMSVVACPVGYRAEDDYLAKEKKVRFPKEQVIEMM